MKLLLGQTETITKDNLKLSVKVVTTAIQARISDLSTDSSIEGRIKMVGYMLNNVIESIEIDGKEYAPSLVSSSADISDPDTLKTIMSIGAIVIGVCFPSQEDEKK